MPLPLKITNTRNQRQIQSEDLFLPLEKNFSLSIFDCCCMGQPLSKILGTSLRGIKVFRRLLRKKERKFWKNKSGLSKITLKHCILTPSLNK